MKKIRCCFVIFVLFLTGCAGQSGNINRAGNYFFPENIDTCVYRVQSSELSIEEIALTIMEIRCFEEGSLYELKWDDDKEGVDAYGTSGLYLGLFFVQGDKIYFIREEDVKEELVSVESITELGTLVCQEEERADALDAGERGWHESITADGSRREYRGYNTLTETGYYEGFVWEQGKGLVECRSGYGAARDAVELYLEENTK